jgi:hypothetical protein
VPSPNRGTGKNELYAAKAVSTTNVWAVGSSRNGANRRTLIEHWNGRGWSIVHSPSPSTGTPHLYGICEVPGRNRLWAVGNVTSSGVDSRSLIEHWNGHRWTRVPLPPPVASYEALKGCVALSSTDAWAVGTGLLHWDGRSWNLVSTPSITDFGGFGGITRNGRGHALWAVGRAGDSGYDNPMSARWTASAGWQQMPVPIVCTGTCLFSGLNGVAAIAPKDVWAVGDWDPDLGGLIDPVLEHWDGTTWTYVGFHQDDNSDLWAITRVPHTATLWAVGDEGLQQPFVARGP